VWQHGNINWIWKKGDKQEPAAIKDFSVSCCCFEPLTLLLKEYKHQLPFVFREVVIHED
jgi:hypothetical protein